MTNTLQPARTTSRIGLRAASAALAFAVALAPAVVTKAQTLTTLASFDGTAGANPEAPLVQAANGDLYGTTLNGGSTNYGAIFKVTPGGTLTGLYSFCTQAGCPDGDRPAAGLVQIINGDLYGTTQYGGTNGQGTLFEITPSGTLTTLDSFSNPYPTAGLVQAANGDLYGTTPAGGINDGGTVFKITPGGVLTTIYNFCPFVAETSGGIACSESANSAANGYSPAAGLIQATNGDLYGTTTEGGTTESVNGNFGTVFKITPNGALTTLYSFCSKSNSQINCLDGYDPLTTLVQAANGYIYGTTQSGRAAGEACAYVQGCGTIFRITPSGTLTTLYSFCSQSACADGAQGGFDAPALMQATDGNLYGAAPFGGATDGGTSTNGYGTIFKITPSGEMTTLYTFCIETGCPDGGRPSGGLVQDTNGTFYGTTYVGGTNPLSYGTVFRLSVGLGPFVKIQPISGVAGETVEILGSDLTGATSVSFNGTAANFNVVSKSVITTTVPAGATTGQVQVTTPGGTLTTHIASFQVLP